MTPKPRKQRGKNKVRHSEFWEQGYIIGMTKTLSAYEGIKQVFNYILTEIGEYKEKTPTNVNPAPTHARVQLAMA